MTFLIADDSPRMRESFKRTILRNVPDGHTVYQARNGGEAIQMYENLRPDWVLMDIRMEPVGGLEASRVILAAHPDAKIIILTNYDDAGYRKAAREAGVHKYILKEQLNEIPGILTGETRHE
ncbi:MAG: response regulator transcription factor [Ignavibacteriales bacterium]|nr:response regulator transcription factor [Ignavibacteriales bacterium]